MEGRRRRTEGRGRCAGGRGRRRTVRAGNWHGRRRLRDAFVKQHVGVSAAEVARVLDQLEVDDLVVVVKSGAAARRQNRKEMAARRVLAIVTEYRSQLVCLGRVERVSRAKRTRARAEAETHRAAERDAALRRERLASLEGERLRLVGAVLRVLNQESTAKDPEVATRRVSRDGRCRCCVTPGEGTRSSAWGACQKSQQRKGSSRASAVHVLRLLEAAQRLTDLCNCIDLDDVASVVSNAQTAAVLAGDGGGSGDASGRAERAVGKRRRKLSARHKRTSAAGYRAHSPRVARILLVGVDEEPLDGLDGVMLLTRVEAEDVCEARAAASASVTGRTGDCPTCRRRQRDWRRH